jgi:antitoxin (DNA-binding transcriptional repressor) of toxin-antitoxin stability system
MYHGCMSEKTAAEVRRELAAILNTTAVRGEITYITQRGRRVAAIVPLHVAEAAEADS